MAQEAADKADKGLSREDWRLVMPIHLADTREEAIRDVDEGNQQFNKDYFENTLGRPADPSVKPDVASQVERGGAIVGTPDDAIAAIERMQQMRGGFGALLGLLLRGAFGIAGDAQGFLRAQHGILRGGDAIGGAAARFGFRGDALLGELQRLLLERGALAGGHGEGGFRLPARFLRGALAVFALAPRGGLRFGGALHLDALLERLPRGLLGGHAPLGGVAQPQFGLLARFHGHRRPGLGLRPRERELDGGEALALAAGVALFLLRFRTFGLGAHGDVLVGL